MMKNIAIYFLFLSIIIVGCASNNRGPLLVDGEDFELQGEALKDLEIDCKNLPSEFEYGMENV